MGLRERLKKLFINSFIKDVGKLSIGTFAGKAITVAALPLLTRIYSPEDFALLAVYMALVSTISVISCLRYEIAIPLAESDEDVADLLIASITSLVVVIAMVVAIILLLSDNILNLIKQPSMGLYLWLVPFGIAATGIYAITQNYSTRARWFAKIARIRIGQAFVGNSTSLVLGYFGFAPLGLLIGNLINTSAGGFRLFFSIGRNELQKIKKTTYQSVIKTLQKYRRFPVYSAPESLFNTAANQIPIVIIGIYAGVEAGFMALAMQVMVLPSRLMAGAISQVYVSRAPQAYNDGRLGEFTKSSMINLTKIGIGPFLLLAAISPIVIPYIFGENWERSGAIINWLMPWTLMQFIVSPVSMALHVVGKQRTAMILQFFGMTMRIGSVVFAVYFLPEHLVEIYSIGGVVFYMIYGLIIFKAIIVGDRKAK